MTDFGDFIVNLSYLSKLSDFGQMDLSKYKLTVAVSDDFVTICYNVTLKGCWEELSNLLCNKSEI